MWLTASDWLKWYDSWMNDPLTTIDAEQLEQNVNNAFKTVFKCVKHFKEIPACQEVAMEVKDKIENFKPYIPLIQGLRNPGMRSRHWEQVGPACASYPRQMNLFGIIPLKYLFKSVCRSLDVFE